MEKRVEHHLSLHHTVGESIGRGSPARITTGGNSISDNKGHGERRETP